MYSFIYSELPSTRPTLANNESKYLHVNSHEDLYSRRIGAVSRYLPKLFIRLSSSPRLFLVVSD